MISTVEISQTSMYIFWAAAILIFGIVEALTAQLVSIWFLAGAITALIASAFSVPFAVQIIIFVCVTILALVITRPLVKKYVIAKKQRTNADRVIGQIGITCQRIDNINAEGQVKIDGKIWTARSCDNTIIPENTKVLVEKIEGVKLIVKTINN